MTVSGGSAPRRYAALAEALSSIGGVSGVREYAPVAQYTTWRVGGAADLVCVAEEVEALVSVIRLAIASGLPWRVLGRGSNVLVRDSGIDGLIVLNRTSKLAIQGVTVRADSGLLLSTLAKKTGAAGLAGLEWSSGIPGSIGGAVVSNAGAHGGSISDSLRRVRLIDIQGTDRWVEASALGLAYRHSLLRETSVPADVVLEAEFVLTEEPASCIKARMDEQRRHRKATQPLASASAGSVFKNPPGDSAARLIDEADLKGISIGGAMVSGLHANFMIADQGASAADLLALIELVRDRVRERSGVELVLEVQPIGRQAPACA